MIVLYVRWGITFDIRFFNENFISAIPHRVSNGRLNLLVFLVFLVYKLFY